MKKKAAAALLIVSVCVGVLMICRSRTSGDKSTGIELRNGYERESFLNLKGLDVTGERCESIVIPDSFDGVYEEYAALQEQQKLPLNKYKGNPCERYLYNVRDKEGVCAELILCEDRLIAAAVLSLSETPGFSPLLQ